MSDSKTYTVGETAKKLGTTVRTLQYYDKEGLLSPSKYSESGRRLYTEKDIVGLYQILSLKELGFSLADIRERALPLDTPRDVLKLVEAQKLSLSERIKELEETVQNLDALSKEITYMEQVDFTKYAHIITLLKEHNQQYWTIKYFSEKTLDSVSSRFTPEQAEDFIKAWKTLCGDISRLKKTGISPVSEEGQKIAARWWEHIITFTGGDMSLIPELIKFNEQRDSWDESWKKLQDEINDFIQQALEFYFKNQGINIGQK